MNHYIAEVLVALAAAGILSTIGFGLVYISIKEDAALKRRQQPELYPWQVPETLSSRIGNALVTFPGWSFLTVFGLVCLYGLATLPTLGIPGLLMFIIILIVLR